MSVVGFQEPINDLETVLCIPCSTTIGTLPYGTWTAFTAPFLAKAGIVLPEFLNSACGGTDTPVTPVTGTITIDPTTQGIL